MPNDLDYRYHGNRALWGDNSLRKINAAAMLGVVVIHVFQAFLSLVLLFFLSQGWGLVSIILAAVIGLTYLPQRALWKRVRRSLQNTS